MDDPKLPSRWIFESLQSKHDRAGFSCGVPELDGYLQRQARQDVDRNLAAVVVMTPDGSSIAGFYSLSAQSIRADDLRPELAKKLPKWPIPVTLLGRMGIRQDFQGKRLGELLLAHALERAWLASKQVAAWAVVVDAKAGAKDFYLKNQFVALESQPDRLILPMASIEKLYGP